jgi:hypothetical protein
VFEQIELIALAAYDRIIGLDLHDLPLDGCSTKAPCGGNCSGPSPVDRRKVGLKRSTVTDAAGIPLGVVTAPGNRHDSPLLIEDSPFGARVPSGRPPRDDELRRFARLDRSGLAMYWSIAHDGTRV